MQNTNTKKQEDNKNKQKKQINKQKVIKQTKGY